MARRRHSIQELDLSLQLRKGPALAALAALTSRRVGDLGCGTGCFSAELARRGHRVTCVDVTQANLDALVRSYSDLVAAGSLTPVHADLTSLPVDTESLDGAVCMEVLEHVEDDRKALAEIARVLEPAGILVVTVPNRNAPLPLVERLGLESVHDRPGPEYHVRPGYDAKELATILSGAGFDVVSVSGVGGRLYRLTSGLVSLANHGYRRLRGQEAWTWADLEKDVSLPMRLYAVVFPLLLFLSRLERRSDLATRSTLVVTAKRRA